jgi:hypothetical protein
MRILPRARGGWGVLPQPPIPHDPTLPPPFVNKLTKTMKRILDAAIPRAVHSERDKASCPVYGFNNVTVQARKHLRAPRAGASAGSVVGQGIDRASRHAPARHLDRRACPVASAQTSPPSSVSPAPTAVRTVQPRRLPRERRPRRRCRARPSAPIDSATRCAPAAWNAATAAQLVMPRPSSPPAPVRSRASTVLGLTRSGRAAQPCTQRRAAAVQHSKRAGGVDQLGQLGVERGHPAQAPGCRSAPSRSPARQVRDASRVQERRQVAAGGTGAPAWFTLMCRPAARDPPPSRSCASPRPPLTKSVAMPSASSPARICHARRSPPTKPIAMLAPPSRCTARETLKPLPAHTRRTAVARSTASKITAGTSRKRSIAGLTETV